MPVTIVGEIGICHNGNMATAKAFAVAVSLTLIVMAFTASTDLLIAAPY